ncbi:rod shape-determining protein RodA [Nocardioides sp. Kera G14]|uniref:rod shape-determining protein RodA n=1 Tax=Nocardioides sp. Kera G14 TaxID=2884264 RepID=UPI001D129300|nr:rod shape-determining protein RodA [Nocardioides sp. Kera G14]UDY24496.1 rod shape-determining protein RodA [Nocardioides sp. Kera G14]
MNPLNPLRRIDCLLLGAVLALVTLSVLLVWSATANRDALTGGDSGLFFRKQLTNVLIGLALMAAAWIVGHRWMRIAAPLIYLGAIAGLLLVLTSGVTINGSRSWLDVGGMSLQPSEFAKLAVVVGMALVLSERSRGLWGVTGRDVLVMLAVAALPALLIIAQPDLGTTLVLAATVFGVLAAAGAPKPWLALLACGGILAAVVAVAGGVLKAYQVDRFMAFTNPALDPQGAGYNTEQARIAIGNGGLFGQGLFHGTQTRAGFVPEQHTDFIFTVAGEELGLVGAAAIILLLGVVLWRALSIARRAQDPFSRVAAAGIACWFGFQAFQNIGMCLGIMPVTGVPLPLLSYGGSSMFASLLAIGLLQNMHASQAASPAALSGRLGLRDAQPLYG